MTQPTVQLSYGCLLHCDYIEEYQLIVAMEIWQSFKGVFSGDMLRIMFIGTSRKIFLNVNATDHFWC